jgi:hypothetical protein
MTCRSTLLAPLLLALSASLGTGARAAITAFWVPVASGDGSVGTTYPSRAFTAPDGDPLLMGMQTWDLFVITDGDWASAGLRATLPVGSSFYRRYPDGSGDTGFIRPLPNFYPIFPNLEFWSYIRVPHDAGGPPFELAGGFPSPSQQPSNGSPASVSPGTFHVSWHDVISTPPSPPGGYQIARLTFPLGTVADVLTIDQSPTFSHTSQRLPELTAAIPDIPEPFTAPLLYSAAILICRRHQSRKSLKPKTRNQNRDRSGRL